MNTYEFLKMAEKEVADSLAIIRKKGESYGAAEDVFFNFRQTAERMFPEMPIHEGMFLVAEVLKDKHSVALAKGMYVNECRERLLDNLNYTLFQLAMIAEAEQMEEFNTNERELIEQGLQEVAQKKAPVVKHGCEDCNYRNVKTGQEPCANCRGWTKKTGDALPGWEPRNG